MTEGINGSDVARDTATVLLHVALADGNADATEVSRIQAVVAHQAKARGVEAPSVDAASVTEASVSDALGRLAALPTQFKANLVDNALVLADSDGNVDANEVATVSAIANGLFGADDASAALWLANAKMAVRKAEQKLGLRSAGN